MIVVTFQYGATSGAEGVCTERLTDTLHQMNVPTRVITKRTTYSRAKLAAADTVPSWTGRPTQLQARIGRLITGYGIADWDWVLRVERCNLARRSMVYGRGLPMSGLLAASRLARRNGLPLALHFSDPVPSPWNTAESARASAPLVRRLVEGARHLTFTTTEAIDYMQNVLDMGIAAKSTVIRNIVPDWDLHALAGGYRPRQIMYVGGFAGRRTPFTLLEGIKRYNAAHPDRPAKLCLAGSSATWQKSVQGWCNGQIETEYLPVVPDPVPYYIASDISVVIDADDKEPVFLATKTGEAMHAARKVLVISPPGSPARTLFDKAFQSVSFVTHEPEKIAISINALIVLSSETASSELRRRHGMLADFRPRAVCRRLLESFGLLPNGQPRR